MSDVIPVPDPSDAFLLPEADYRYGVGPIMARVQQVISRVAYYNEPWLTVIAEVAEDTRDGHGPWIERRLYVREAACPRASQVLAGHIEVCDGGAWCPPSSAPYTSFHVDGGDPT